MIGLDSTRNIIQDMEYIEKDLSEKEFLIIDNIEEINETESQIDYHFEPYGSENLIYLGEMDLVYSIYNLNEGLLLRAPYKKREGYIQPWIAPVKFEIPHLKRLLKNKGITKSNASEKIKERDDNHYQLCGETDIRTLNVHHIIPRASPFFHDSFINSPLNQITLCANCHRIEHWVMEHGISNERKEHVKKMFDINGAHFRGGELHELHYAPMSEIKKYK